MAMYYLFYQAKFVILLVTAVLPSDYYTKREPEITRKNVYE